MQSHTIDDIPREILATLTDYLPHGYANVLRSVCKKWRAIFRAADINMRRFAASESLSLVAWIGIRISMAERYRLVPYAATACIIEYIVGESNPAPLMSDGNLMRLMGEIYLRALSLGNVVAVQWIRDSAMSRSIPLRISEYDYKKALSQSGRRDIIDYEMGIVLRSEWDEPDQPTQRINPLCNHVGHSHRVVCRYATNRLEYLTQCANIALASGNMALISELDQHLTNPIHHDAFKLVIHRNHIHVLQWIGKHPRVNPTVWSRKFVSQTSLWFDDGTSVPSLDTLKWLVDNKLDWGVKDGIYRLVKYAPAETLEWALDVFGNRFGEYEFLNACTANNLDNLKIIQRRLPPDTRINVSLWLDVGSKSETIELIEWLRENNHNVTITMQIDARASADTITVRDGINMRILKWYYKDCGKVPRGLAIAAVSENRFDVLMWLHEIRDKLVCVDDSLLDPKLMKIAARVCSLNVIEYLIDIGCPGSDEVFTTLLMRNDTDLVGWYIERGMPLGSISLDEASDIAYKYGCDDVAGYIVGFM